MITVASKHVLDGAGAALMFYKKIGLIDSFQDMLDNIFLPLFEVTRDPSSDPKLHWYLKQLVAFDCVDAESKAEPRLRNYPKPADWTSPENPPYSYWLSPVGNLRSLNAFRAGVGSMCLHCARMLVGWCCVTSRHSVLAMPPHQPRRQFAKVTGAPVPFLFETGWHRNVASV